VRETGKRLLECAESWEPSARLLGNITAKEIAEYVQKAEEMEKALELIRDGVYRYRKILTPVGLMCENLHEIAKQALEGGAE
jgi:hypothetical protein